MFEALIITLREGVEAALVIGIILAYLRKIGREELNRSVYIGLMLAIGASILGAVALSRVGLNEELFEGIAMLIAALFVGTMIIWMWRTARQLKSEIEQLRAENARLSAEIQALRSDPLAIERLAREELGLSRPGETLFVIRDESRR